MIIQCQACRARYRLDESKIKGKGARIRCRKCGESIIVMKSEIPAAGPSPLDRLSPPPKKERFDLRAELRAPDRPVSSPRQEEAPPAFEQPAFREAAGKPGLSPVADRQDPPAHHPEATGDAVETLLRADRETEGTAAAGETFPLRPPDASNEIERLPIREPEEEPVPSPDTGEEIEHPLFREPEKKSVPPPDAGEAIEHPPLQESEEKSVPPPDAGEAIEHPPLQESEEKSVPPPDAGEAIEHPPFQEPEEESVPPPDAGEEIDRPLFRDREEESSPPSVAVEPPSSSNRTDTPFVLELEKEEELSFLRDEGTLSGRTAGDGIRAEIPVSPKPEKEERESPEYLILDLDPSDTLRGEDPPREPDEKYDISGSLGRPSESRAESIQDQLSGLAEAEPVERIPVPEPRPPVVPPPRPLETAGLRDVPRRVPSSPARPSIALLILLFLTLAGAGAYLAFTKPGQEALRTIAPGLESFWLGGKDSVNPFRLGNARGNFESSGLAGRLFVIRGDVTNLARKPRSAIRVRAELLDGNRRTVAEQTAYAGNIVTDLRGADRKTIDDAMANRFGDALINVDVPPGKSLPFMVVIFDPPEGVSEYRLEALEGD